MDWCTVRARDRVARFSDIGRRRGVALIDIAVFFKSSRGGHFVLTWWRSQWEEAVQSQERMNERRLVARLRGMWRS